MTKVEIGDAVCALYYCIVIIVLTDVNKFNKRYIEIKGRHGE